MLRLPKIALVGETGLGLLELLELFVMYLLGLFGLYEGIPAEDDVRLLGLFLGLLGLFTEVLIRDTDDFRGTIGSGTIPTPGLLGSLGLLGLLGLLGWIIGGAFFGFTVLTGSCSLLLLAVVSFVLLLLENNPFKPNPRAPPLSFNDSFMFNVFGLSGPEFIGPASFAATAGAEGAGGAELGGGLKCFTSLFDITFITLFEVLELLGTTELLLP